MRYVHSVRNALSILMAVATLIIATGNGYAATFGSISAEIMEGRGIGETEYRLGFGVIHPLDSKSASVTLSMVPESSDSHVLVAHSRNVKVTSGKGAEPMYGYFWVSFLQKETTYHLYVTESLQLNTLGVEGSANPLRMNNISTWIYDKNSLRWNAVSTFTSSGDEAGRHVVVLAELNIPAGAVPGVYHGTYDIFFGTED